MQEGANIRWDVAEEHLEEAAFLFKQWEEALCSPDYTLDDIANGPEERLLAHLDGLVLGGSKVAKKLLLPSLSGDDNEKVFAAAFALVAGEQPDDFDAVISALENGSPEQRAAIRRALALAPRTGLGQQLIGLATEVPSIQADLLEVLGYLQVDSGLRLEPLVNSKDPAKEALAIRINRVFPDRLNPLAVQRAFVSPHPEVRAAALETGLILGSRGAYEACEATVKARGPGFGAAALLMGLSGDASSASVLLDALSSEPKLKRQAIFALGFCGQIFVADALLDLMVKEEKLAPLAAEGFAAITGLRIEKEFAQAPKRWNPDDEESEEEEEEYGPEADLPKPKPDAIVHWWKEAKPKFDPAQRWLRGHLWSVDRLLLELKEGPARRREALSLDLAIRTRSQVLVAWNALSGRQWAELAEVTNTAIRVHRKSYREISPYSSQLPPRNPAPSAFRD